MRSRAAEIGVLIALSTAAGFAARCSSPSATAKKASPPEAPAPMRVEAVRPTRGSVARRLETVASLEPWEEVTVYAKVSGYLRSIGVDRGDRVGQGDLLAILDVPEMADELRRFEAERAQAEADLERSRADVRLHEVTLRRLEAIRAEEAGAAAQQELDHAVELLTAARASLAGADSRVRVVSAELDRLRTLQDYSRITAPFEGVITERFVAPGALVTAGTQSKPTPIVHLVSSSLLRAMVDVPEADAAHVHVGDEARLRVDAYPDRVFRGKVSRFSRALDSRTRTMRTEVLVENEDGTLAAGMFGRIGLDLEVRADVLTLPPAGVRFEKEKAHVFVVEGGRARRLDVVCGSDDGNAVEIVSGLTGSEWVITTASGALSEGAPVTVPSLGGPAGGE